MTPYSVYEKVTGRVVKSGICHKEILHLQYSEGEDILLFKVDDSTHYIKEGEVVLRPIMNLIVSNDSLENIPLGSVIYLDGEYLGECNTGLVELVKEDNSVYKIRVECFPYLDEEVDV